MKNLRTKMIRIVSRGFVLSSRGRIMTPILTPYREDMDRIWSMLTVDRADIEEKLNDGSFIPLTVQNFDKDNNKKLNPPVTGEATFTNKDYAVKAVVEDEKGNVSPVELRYGEMDEQKVEAPNTSPEKDTIKKEALEDSDGGVSENGLEESETDEQTDEELGDSSENEETTPTNVQNGNRNRKKNRNRNRQGVQTNSTPANSIEVKPESV